MIKMKKNKKKSHGGLKFLAFLCVVGVVVGLITVGRGTEAGARILGNREDRRLENTVLTPRFSYAAATLRISVGSIYNNDTNDDRHHHHQRRVDRSSV